MKLAPSGGLDPRFSVRFGRTANAAFDTEPAREPKILRRFQMPSVTDRFEYSAQGGRKAETGSIQGLIDGGQIFGKVSEALSKARSSVLVDLYNLQTPTLYPDRVSPPGTPGSLQQAAIADKLIALHRRGVKVKVIIDNHWQSQEKEGHNDRTIAYLRQNGIDVVTYPDFAKINHLKLLIVDDKFAMVSGMNWGNHSPTNHDAAVFIEGPEVRNIYNEVFRPDWISCGRDPAEIPNLKPFDHPDRKIKILQTTSREHVQGPKDEIFRELLHQIAEAKESIFAELFVLTQPEIVDSLTFAHKRLMAAGKEGVKILVDPGLFFAFPHTRTGVQRLAKAGVPIKFYETDRNIEEKLHGKWAVFDQKKLLIGSANWSRVGLLSNGRDKAPPGAHPQRVSRGNHELGLLIDSEKVARNFANQLRYDWHHASFPVMESMKGRWRPVRPTAEADID